MQQIYHKKNELFEVQFYKDKECTEAFDFTNSKNIYINRRFDLQVVNYVIESSSQNAQIFIPYIPQDCINCIMSAIISRNCDNKEPDDYDNVKVFTLTQINKMWDEDKIESITPNLSKYIPEDNAVLFLREKDFLSHKDCIRRMRSVFFKDENNQFQTSYGLTGNLATKEFDHLYRKRFAIFLTHGTQSEIQKANEVAKELKEKYGVEEVNLCVLHCFVKFENLSFGAIKLAISREYDIDNFNFNKIITTNSTGILPVQNTERLQVIDCKEIFEEYLKENN